MYGIVFTAEFVALALGAILSFALEQVPGLKDLWANKVPAIWRFTILSGLALLISFGIAYGPCAGIPTYEGAVCNGWDWQLSGNAFMFAALAVAGSQGAYGAQKLLDIRQREADNK